MGIYFTKGFQDQFCLQNIQSSRLFYITVPRDVKLPNLPLLGGES